VTRGDDSPISIKWEAGGRRKVAFDSDDALREARLYAGFSTSLLPGADGCDRLVVPLTVRAEVVGCIVGEGIGLDPTRAETARIAAVAAHATACMARAMLEVGLAESHEARGQFIAALSHELRTPLTAVLGYSELLLSGAPTEDQDRIEFLGAIRDSAEHLLALVADVLDVARAETMELTLGEAQPVELASAFAEVERLVGPQAADRGILVVAQIPEGHVVEGDRRRIIQILTNIVSNAVKFSENAPVHITSRIDRGSIVVEVADLGRGIPADELAKLFRPFSRGGDASVGGTGLGLVISRRLAEAMGGSLELHSEGAGRGATARIALPRAVATEGHTGRGDR
jgi:signal transduction histidine kinase